jgi:hypothetical protein
MRDLGKTVTPSGSLGVATRPAKRLRAATWASGDVLPSLSRRAAELEALAKSLQSDLDRATERLAAYSEFDPPLERALVDAYTRAQEIEQKARMEADTTLERAMDQRHLLSNDLDRLRGQRDDITDEIAFARRGRFIPLRAPTEPARDPAPDHRLALAAEMRVMLLALLNAHFGERPGPPPPKTPAHPPRTLLRAPVSGRRKAEFAPRRDVQPTMIRPLRVAPLITPLLPVTTPTTDVIEPAPLAAPVATVAAAEAAAIVMPSEMLEVESAPQGSAPTTDLAENPAISASDHVGTATEPAAEVIAVETMTGEATTVETEMDPRVIALQLVDMASANVSDIEAEREPERAIEAVRPEPMPFVLAPSQVVPERASAEAVDVAPTELHEVPEEVISQVQPAVEEQALTTIEPRLIDEMWESALETTEQTETPEAADASLASPFEAITEPAIINAEPVIFEPPPMAEAASPDTDGTLASIVQESAVAPLRAARELQLVLSPITSFPQLLAIQQRIASLSSVNGIHLRDFRNGVATFAAGVTDALSGREFGSVLQMLTELQLRLEGATENSVELRVGPQAH